MIFFSLVLLAISAPLVYSSTPKPPHLEVNHLQDLTPSSDPLENVRALLSEQITSLSALPSQITGADYPNSYGPKSARQTLTNAIPEPSIIPLNVQTPLYEHVKEMQELKLVNTNPNTVAGPCIPEEPLPFSPIPPNWNSELARGTCHRCLHPIPHTEFCRKRCANSRATRPVNNNSTSSSTSLNVEQADGSPVPVIALIDLAHFPSFISDRLVHSLGLESNVTPWPADASDKNPPEGPTDKIIGTIPITLANFTKEQLKYEDVFYVFIPLESTDKLSDLTVGIELLRQISGLAVHPDVIV